MNAEYQRLDAEARGVEDQMRELPLTVDLRSAADLAKWERQMADLGRQLASLRLGMALIRAVNSPEMRTREREFVRELPKRFHSQGTREKGLHLPGGVTVTLSVTYYHRCKSPETSRQNGRRGLYPMLMLLGIVGRDTPQVRQRMAKAAALLGSYDEAVGMLAEDGLCVCVNPLRDVTAGMGRMLQRLTHQGSLTVCCQHRGGERLGTADGRVDGWRSRPFA